MPAQKVDFDSIKWETQGRLYRGTLQSYFESMVLRSIAKGEGRHYYGQQANYERPCRTYFGTHLFDAAVILHDRHPDYHSNIPCVDGRPHNWPFTQYPLVMEVDAEKYRDDLFKEEDDRLTIGGPIALDDITILFSSHINRIQNRPDIQLVNNFIKMYGLSADKNLLEHLLRNPKKVAQALHFCSFGPRRAYEKRDVERLEESIVAVAEKLQFPEYQKSLRRFTRKKSPKK